MNKKDLLKVKDHLAPTGLAEKLGTEYVMTVSEEDINRDKVLFLSLFSTKSIKGKANFKIFISGKDYISQKLQDDLSYKWSNACLDNLLGYWWYDSKKKITCIDPKHRKCILNYLKTKSKEDEFKIIDKYQKAIMQEKLNAKHEKITKRIDKAMDKVPELPKDFERWVYNVPFDHSRYIYYKRKGNKINCFCTECKKEFDIHETKRTKENIKHNNSGTCPSCNRKIFYKAEGKTKNHIDRSQFSIIQKYEDGIIIRYFSGSKTYKEHYKNPTIFFYEKVRTICKAGKEKMKTKSYEHTEFLSTGKVRWCDDRGYFAISETFLYTRNINAVIENTKWKYSSLYDYAKKVKSLHVIRFLGEYIKYPAIEYLVKLKLYRFLKESLDYGYRPLWSTVNFNGKNIKEVLGVGKEELLRMQKFDVGAKEYEFIKILEKNKRKLTDDQFKWVVENVNCFDMDKMLQYSTSNKIINYVNKQSNSEYSCKNVLTDWTDYVEQCKELKYDLNNTFVLYPKNLQEKHEEYSIMIKSKGLEKYDKKIKKEFIKLNEVYSLEDKNLIIRPVSCVNELVKEGHMLRHCVGGMGYAGRVASGEIAIMLIRKKDNPEEPYHTLELDLKHLEIRQCRRYKNWDPTEDVEKFIKKWKQKKLIKNKMKKAM